MNEREIRKQTLKTDLEQKMRGHRLSNQNAETSVEEEREFSGLEPDIIEALRRYDPSTGYLLNNEVECGAMDGSSIRTLNEKDLLQRLRMHGLIFSGGKLTSKALRLSVAWLEVMNEPQSRNPELEKNSKPIIPIRPFFGHNAETSGKQGTELPSLEPEEAEVLQHKECLTQEDAGNQLWDGRPQETPLLPGPSIMTETQNDPPVKAIFSNRVAPCNDISATASITRYKAQDSR